MTGSLEAAIETFLKTETGRRRQDFELLLGHWTEALPNRNRLIITPAEIQRVLDTWRAEGVAASTINHRRQALRTLYRRLDPEMVNPVDKTKPFKQPEPEPRAVPEDVLAKVFEVMPDSTTKARLQIIMHTGMRHSELARVRIEDVHLDDAQPNVFVRSGKGGHHRVVPLHALAVEAFRALIRHEGFGEFSRDSARKVWLNALSKLGLAQKGKSEAGHVVYAAGAYRPYDLRHRFATRLRERGADLADVQELLGHRSIQTTRRYAPVVHDKLVRHVEALVVPVAGEPAGAKPEPDPGQ